MFRKINIAFALTVLALVAFAASVPEWRPVTGIILRLLFAGFCFLNCIVLLARGKPLITVVLLAAVGLGLVVTALLGYGFNGQPLLSWMP